MITTLEAINYVQAGSAALTAYDPTWPMRVNRETLDIAVSVNCVVGQVFGSFYQGLNRLTHRDEMDLWVSTQEAAAWARDHGLDCTHTDAVVLNAVWRLKVEAEQNRALKAAA